VRHLATGLAVAFMVASIGGAAAAATKNDANMTPIAVSASAVSKSGACHDEARRFCGHSCSECPTSAYQAAYIRCMLRK